MSNSIINENFELRPIERLKGLRFFVDDYQRGYKWQCQQTLDLLNDINDFRIEDGIYCLQPIVTKARDDVHEGKVVYELIDGQQRMSTIFMLLNTNEETEQFFEIEYGTRPKSAEFLKSINSLKQFNINAELLDETRHLEEQIKMYWEEFIALENNSAFNNVDNFHFFLSYQTICLWVNQQTEEDLKSFFNKLLSFTNIIWYQVNSDEVSEEVFININSGKIELTNAELIKALFLINCKDGSNKELAAHQQNEIAQEWDRIENALQNDEFWYFINENPKNNIVPTRIDFLFDLLSEKSKRESDAYYSYRVYAKKTKEGEKLDWEEVKNLYENLNEWFEDRNLYHLIGFIITQKISTITSLINLSKGLLKSEFEQNVLNLICSEFKKTDLEGSYKYHLDNLDYNNAYNETLAVLLLFNIETYQISESNYRFPFDRYKEERWSIEHIHAQNARLFTKIKEIKEWVQDINVLIDDMEESSSKAETFDEIKLRLKELTDLNSDEDITPEVKLNLVELSDEIVQYLNMHKITNLALLDGITNSSIGRKNFLQKREAILNIDKKMGEGIEKSFIPICTKNVFLKYYTVKNEDIQMSYWGYQDGLDYKTAISTVLNKYYIEDDEE